MRKLLAVLLLLAWPAYADMYPDASNAKLPAAQDNLAIPRSVEAYGAKCDGTTDDTAALQAAINANQTSTPGASVAELAIPTGDCLTGTLTIAGQLHMRGQNAQTGSRLVLKATTTTPLLIVQTTGDAGSVPDPRITIRDLMLVRAGGRDTGVGTSHGIDLRPGSYRITLELDRVTVFNFAGSGMYRTPPWAGAVLINNSQFVSNQIGIQNNSGPDWSINLSQFYLNELDGIAWSGAANASFTNVASYSNGRHGLNIFGVGDGNTWTSGSIDRNGQYGIWYNGVTKPWTFTTVNFVGNSASAASYGDIGIEGATTAPPNLISPIMATTYTGSAYNIKFAVNSTTGAIISGSAAGIAPGVGSANFTNWRPLVQLPNNSVQTYGAKCDGVTNDSAAIQAAIDANYYRVITLPANDCVVNGLNITKSIRITGQGMRQSRLVSPLGGANPVFTMTVNEMTNFPAVVQLENFTVAGVNKTDPPGVNLVHGIKINPITAGGVQTELRLTDMTIDGVPGSCLYTDSGENNYGVFVVANNFNCVLPGQYGIYANTAGDWLFYGGSFYGAGVNNILCAGCAYFQLMNVAVFSSAGEGIHLFDPIDWQMTGGGVDRNGEHGVVVDIRSPNRVARFNTVAFAVNGTKTTDTYSDMYIAAGNIGAIILDNARFQDRTTAAGNRPLNNLSIAAGNTGIVTASNTTFGAGNRYTAGTLAGQTQFYRSGDAPIVYTVATLPACGAGNKYATAAVSDATAPAYNAALTGGGAVAVPVMCDGAAWKAH